jgi:hypothetical protein
MVHPQALVEPMGLPLRTNLQKRKTNGTEFSNRDKLKQRRQSQKKITCERLCFQWYCKNFILQTL